MIMSTERMRRLRRLSIVPRWNIATTLRGQTVADHTFHVMWLSYWLLSLWNRHCTKTLSAEILLVKALVHDEAEAISGDIAGPYKGGSIGEAIAAHEKARGWGHVFNHEGWGDEYKLLIKAADFLDALLFVWEERDLGNQTLLPVERDILKKLDATWDKMPELKEALPLQKLVDKLREGLQSSIHPGLEETK